jgi:glycerol-3-phosphate dehydrogenase (NAD(P)+)
MAKEKAVVVGTTSWGTTLALVLARRGMKVHLLARTEDEAANLNEKRENSTLLPGIRLPSRIQATASPEEAFEGAKLALLVVPAQTMRENVKWIKDYLTLETTIISAAKGIEIDTGKRMSQVISEEIAPELSNRICVLSGPNLAKEVARGLHAVTVIASENNVVMEEAQKMIMAPHFYAFTNSDVIGVELGGALKNIIALGVGIIEGMGHGDNIKAACITRGLTEITSLGMAMGANPLTFAGLSGLGDIIVTCSSKLSRNHFVGVELGKGRTLKEITSSIPYVVEGITTTEAAYKLAIKTGVDMPITSLMYRVLFHNLSIKEAAAELLEYPHKYELGIGDRIRPGING